MLRSLLVILWVGVAFAAPHKKAPQKTARQPPKAKKIVPKNDVERLGLGVQQFLDGDYASARATLAPLEGRPLHNTDYALYFQAQAELLDGKAVDAAKHFDKLTTLDSRFRVVAKWRAADARWEAGQTEEAKKLYEALLKTNPPASIEPAVARYRSGDFRQVYVKDPLHPLAEEALKQLKDVPPIGVLERIARAKVMTDKRAWQQALDELGLIPAELAGPLRDEADYWIGTNHFRMRHGYDIAAEKLLAIWARLPGDLKVDALFHGARALSRADLDDQAIVKYREVVTKFPRTKLGAEASFLIGWLEFNRGRYKDALPGLEETLKKYGTSEWEDDARWYLGFSRWLTGDTAGALADFDKLGQHDGALSGGKGLYWKGRALEKLGKTDEAKGVWQKVAALYPFTYYALSARARLKERNADAPMFTEKKGAPPFPALDAKLATDPLIQRVDELLAAGLTVEASAELAERQESFLKQYGVQRALPMLFDRYLRGEDFFHTHRLAERFGGAALRLDPQADKDVRGWWEKMYPLAYRKYVEKYAPTGENPPYYLYTIMQKESAYNPHDVSYADAIGLLQMIPPTSRRVGEKIDYPYTDDILYDPEGNIRFGAWYIGHLLKKFHGQVPIGAGSYNAGPRAMMKWLAKNGEHPLDEFIELCPYTQTREYMKKALDIYARYVYLYEKDDYLPALKVDTGPLDDGIDY